MADPRQCVHDLETFSCRLEPCDDRDWVLNNFMFPPVLLGSDPESEKVIESVRLENCSLQVVPFSQQRTPGIEDGNSSCPVWNTERGAEYDVLSW